MTVLNRGARSRRGGRRPGWLLLTVLLVLAIVASSALVFTNRVELLKLAVILALWAAVVAAFVSVIYRRQSDIDQAKARDLKLVYDLQLDREISARREYELSVETQLRRELASELRAQAADEVAGLRAELAALRANLEILFDADLSHRPAIETERRTVRAYSDWASDAETTGRVTSNRIDAEDREDHDFRTEESPIIDVPEEPHPPEYEWVPPFGSGGAHRLMSEEPIGEEQRAAQERAATEERAAAHRAAEQRAAEELAAAQRAAEQRAAEQRAAEQRAAEERRAAEQRAAEERRAAEQRAAEERRAAEWQPAPSEGQWIPAGTPGSNWTSPVTENGTSDSSEQYVGRRRAPEPAMSSPPAEPPRGRHSTPPEVGDPGRRSPPPTLSAEPAQPPPPPEAAPSPPVTAPAAPRHRSADDTETTGGQSVAELLSRLQATPTGGGRRRRRDE
jgi:hypothetical protein